MKSSDYLSKLPLCDIVMEGGITSGVIYPSAVVKISEHFRIKNIGGTSAGAIAAAATAAAELGRLKNPDENPGFKRLKALSKELAQKVDGIEEVTRLQNLFQPNPQTRPLYTILISLLNRKTKKGIVWGLGVGALKAFPFKLFLSIALPAVLYYFFGHLDVYSFLLTIFLIIFISTAVAGFSTWQVVKDPMTKNGFGICKGYTSGDDKKYENMSAHAPLTLWLSRLINECADKAPDDEPLTFGELWREAQDEKSAPPKWLKDAGRTTWKYVNLEMITTNVTHGRPSRFPNDANEKDQKLYFDEDELRGWFPSNVVDHMVAKSVQEEKREGKYLLPCASDLPVVFAARLSLSFPFLLSAVPLYAVDYEIEGNNDRKLERCWFSDGGICSNFPIHLFDSALPLWPTFGINLESEGGYRKNTDLSKNPHVSKTDKNRFFLPELNKKGRGDSWIRFDDEEDGSKKIVGFTLGLLDAARNWRDSMLMRSPGVRDRVVRVYLKEAEGGLNLNMEDNLIEGLNDIGGVAAELLIDRFLPESKQKMNFSNHRWVRLRNFAAVAEKDLSNLHTSLQASLNNKDLQYWYDLITDQYPKDDDQYPINLDQQKKLKKIIEALVELSKCSSENESSLSENAPPRIPTVRIVPDI